jgi:hypothetical protein
LINSAFAITKIHNDGSLDTCQWNFVRAGITNLARCMFISATPISSGLRSSNTVERTVTAIFDNSSAVQSTVTNNKTIQQTVIHLVPMMHNPRITFCHTQIFRKIWQYISTVCWIVLLLVTVDWTALLLSKIAVTVLFP